VIALRQAGFEPVVASMGTALTERHLRELGRLTKRLYLCFDADKAGQDATLRGMELAVRQGFDVKVVMLPEGQDPADAPEGFAERLRSPKSYPFYRTELIIDRAADRQEAWIVAQDFLGTIADSPERQEAVRLLADKLDLPRETLARLAPARGAATAASREGDPPRLLDAGDRLERDVLAACVAHPPLVRGLAELSADHFDSEANRLFRDMLVTGRDDPELTALRAELDARAAQEGIDQRTGQELLLRLRERTLKRELAGADLARTTELQAHLAKVRQALAELT
jgi:DNA primase